MKHIAIVLGAIVVGALVGMMVMMGLHMATTLVYPMPPGLDIMSADPAQQVAFKAWMGTLPAGAFVLTTLAHGIGCMCGAIVGTLIVGRRSVIPAVVIGLFFTVGGISNLGEVPHPAWFAFVDLPIYLALAVPAGFLLIRGRSPARSATSL